MTKPSEARQELLALQADILKRLKAEVRQLVGGRSGPIRKYYRTYKKEFRQIEAISNKEELVKAVREAAIVFCGDFHTLRQSQKTPIRILREVISKRSKITLGLEMVSQYHQAELDLFQAGELSEKEFLARINYAETWGFSWYNYREILDFCRRTQIRVVGLNAKTEPGDESLDRRGTFAALRIAQEWVANPERLLFVLFGDLHLARPFIPAKTEKVLRSLGQKPKTLIIYQNAEKIYWELAKRNLEQSVDVVRLGPGRFCVMSSAPWIMLQSYINWVEGQGALLSDFKGEGELEEPGDFYHHLLELIQTIAVYFKLPQEKLTDFSVFTTKDLEFIKVRDRYLARRGHGDDCEVKLLKSELIEEGSCIFPEEKLVCLSNLSLPRASEKAAQLIFVTFSGNYGGETEKISPRESFYRRVYLEAIGYLGSKIINYKRKCDMLPDYQEFLKKHQGAKLSPNLRLFRDLANRVIKHDQLEKRYLERGKLGSHPKRLYHCRPAIYLKFSRALGEMMGERIYDALIQGAMERDEVKQLFYFRFAKEDAAEKKYFNLARQLQEIKPLRPKKRAIF